MKKKLIFSILLIALILVAIFSTNVLGVGNVIDGIVLDPSTVKGDTTFITNILNIIQYAGIILAIGVLLVFGIQYIVATAQEKADLKGKALNYIIGALILFLAPQIVKLLSTVFAVGTTKT